MESESARLLDMLEKTKKRFESAGADEADAEWIYCRALGIKRSELKKDRPVTQDEAERIRAFEDERATGRPLAYVFGDAEFCGCTIRVDERVLIPRPETELLADAAVKSAKDGNRILDLCTGSGCVAAAVAKGCAARGNKVFVTASDVSEDALELAGENARSNGAAVEFVKSDLFSNICGRFDMVVCNPPYVPSGEIETLQREVRDFEPRLALDGGEDGLDLIRRIAGEIGKHIEEGGTLLLECAEDQAQKICEMFPLAKKIEVIKDLAGIDRFLKITF